VFLIASAFSAALAGVLVNLAVPDLVGSARLLMLTFAVVSVLGVMLARGASWGIGIGATEESDVGQNRSVAP